MHKSDEQIKYADEHGQEDDDVDNEDEDEDELDRLKQCEWVVQMVFEVSLKTAPYCFNSQMMK